MHPLAQSVRVCFQFLLQWNCKYISVLVEDLVLVFIKDFDFSKDLFFPGLGPGAGIISMSVTIPEVPQIIPNIPESLNHFGDPDGAGAVFLLQMMLVQVILLEKGPL